MPPKLSYHFNAFRAPKNNEEAMQDFLDEKINIAFRSKDDLYNFIETCESSGVLFVTGIRVKDYPLKQENIVIYTKSDPLCNTFGIRCTDNLVDLDGIIPAHERITAYWPNESISLRFNFL